MSIFPWQNMQWHRLSACHEENRLPHALLLHGIAGLGKKHFALLLAERLLCHVVSDVPCGQCHSCHLLKAQVHPDFLWIEPWQEGHPIKIDQIRDMILWIHETALQGGLRIVVIHDAHQMNLSAANALLKTLEEPPPKTIVILISDQRLRLPATITSRCQKVFFQKPSRDIAIDWLQQTHKEYGESPQWKLLLNLAQGAPLKAQEFFVKDFLPVRQKFYDGLCSLIQKKSDPIQFAAHYQDQDMLVLFHLLLIWLQDILRFSLTKGKAELINFDYQERLSEWIDYLSQEKLFRYQDQVKKIYAYQLAGLNLNKQLMLEELFIKWVQYATR